MRYFTPLIFAALLSAFALPAQAADPLEGLWLTEGGAHAKFTPCEQGFCITLVSGDFKGQSIGHMTPSAGGKYKGEIRDPADDRTYSGEARINGATLEMKGCFLMFCQTQLWKRL